MTQLSLSTEIRKATGAHYTPTRLAEFVAEAIVSAWRADSPGSSADVLDPAAGDGELLIALLGALAKQSGVTVAATGYDTDKGAVALASRRLRAAFPKATVSVKAEDFLDLAYARGAAGNTLFTEPRGYQHDLVIANPPYVRTQVMGHKRAQRLATEWGLSGRVDLYYAFLCGIASVTRQGGIAGVIVSNRFMTTKGGAAVRKAIRERFDVLHVWDLGDTKLFEAAVLPAVLLLRKKDERVVMGPSLFSSIYSAGVAAVPPQCEHPLDALQGSGLVSCADGRAYIVRHGTLDKSDAVWRVGTEAGDEWLATVVAHTGCTFGQVGKVRVGVKTTADSVFVRSDWGQLPESEQPELLRPLMTHHIGRRYKPEVPDRHIVYPHEVVDGKRRPIDLTRYPRTLKYFERYREQLESRKYVSDAGRRWYEIWVPQDPDAWAAPKVVFRDITEHPTFWMDLSGSVVNGDCYFITKNSHSEDLLWLILAVGNSTFIESFYDHRFHNKLYSGRRRFMTQYVEQFPLPPANTAVGRAIISTVRRLYELTPSGEADALERKLDRLVWGSFGFPIEEVAR